MPYIAGAPPNGKDCRCRCPGQIHQSRLNCDEALKCFHTALALYNDDDIPGALLCSLACSIAETYFAGGWLSKAAGAFRLAADYCSAGGYNELARYAKDELSKIEAILLSNVCEDHQPE